MKARCLTSFFSQKQSGTAGQIMEIEDTQVMDDLLQAGFIEAVNPISSKGENTKTSDVKKTNAKTKKAVDNHENE